MEPFGSSRPLTARSVIASTLLGTHPPRLSARMLVRAGALFGISEGTVRTAMSRMVAAGELEADDGHYRLAGSLLERQARQDASRAPGRSRWRGDWEVAVVVADRRSAPARAELREAMRRLRLAELREGVWLRPDNLDAHRATESSAVVADQCRRFVARAPDDPAQLAAELWDLGAWAATSAALVTDLERQRPAFARGEHDALADGFVLSAAVLRHLLADPLLPGELLPDGWPGDELRQTYDRYDRAFKQAWRAAFAS